MSGLRLNLGAGTEEAYIPGYQNLDIKTGTEAYPLAQYEDNTVDEVRASHLLEHFGHTMTLAVLSEWIRVLKPGGILKIAVPDFEYCARKYIAGLDRPDEPYADEPLDGYVMGGWIDEYDRHGAILDEYGLTAALCALGMTGIEKWESDNHDDSALPVSLNMICRKGTADAGSQRLAAVARQVAESHPAQSRPFDWLAARARNVYSQTGEDGILEAIFEKIGVNNRWCFEVGAGDGTLCSNTRFLIEQGWQALLVEADNALCDSLRTLHGENKGVKIEKAYVGCDGRSLDSLMFVHDLPVNIDLCILDVDGQEWYLWNSMIHYRPRVMVVEYNPQAPTDFVPPRGGDGQAGLNAILKLGNAKGYECVGVTPFNAIFVKRSDVDPLFNAEEVQATVIPDRSSMTVVDSIITTGPDATVPEHVPLTLGKEIAAVMTVPRLMHTETTLALTRSLTPLGIDAYYALGVFWGQCLSRVLRKKMETHRFILTIDYDSIFCASDVLELYKLMDAHPEVGALAAVQMKRSSKSTLFHFVDEAGNVRKRIEFTELQKDVVPIRTGHFGLTMLRSESLMKMPHPWFIPVPDPATQEWDEGRCDEDVNFWVRWNNEGLNLCLAPRVVIGHLETCVTWPNRQLQPFYQHDRDYTQNGKPKGVWR